MSRLAGSTWQNWWKTAKPAITDEVIRVAADEDVVPARQDGWLDEAPEFSIWSDVIHKRVRRNQSLQA